MTHMKLFGTDGIRAEVGTWPLVPDFVLRLGLAAGRVLGDENKPGDTIVIGRDTRQSSPMLHSALTAGLLAGGATVIDAGVITTPGVAYLARRLEAAAGVMISASHNPVHENGIKFFDRDGLKLSEMLEAEIERELEASGETHAARHFGRSIDGKGMHELYVKSLLAEHADLRLDDLALVLDCANGAASWFAPECLARMGARVIAIHASPTGLNINDRAGSEYVRRQPGELGRLVQQVNANFGLAFDGDADRVVFVDERGGIVDGDHMLGILSDYFDQRRELLAGAIVTTTMRNEGLARYARTRQLQMHETPVGDKYVVEKLLDLQRSAPEPDGYAIGGEQAGHVVLMDRDHTTGDGIRTALFIIQAFLESGARSLAEMASIVRKTPQVIASAYVGRGPRLDRAALNDLESECRRDLPALKRVHLRYSGTESQFRAMLEADEQMPEADLARTAWQICRRIQAVAGVDEGFLEILSCSRGGLLSPSEL
ncbi:MAG TPA: phosphoglucosamine mutase [Anaerolineae bacterium]|nr:phosphoglucosamine mutase [Anaerolineae bacterium]